MQPKHKRGVKITASTVFRGHFSCNTPRTQVRTRHDVNRPRDINLGGGYVIKLITQIYVESSQYVFRQGIFFCPLLMSLPLLTLTQPGLSTRGTPTPPKPALKVPPTEWH